jgi:hypothetical protein
VSELERLKKKRDDLRKERKRINKRINEMLRVIKDRMVVLERPGIEGRKQNRVRVWADRRQTMWAMALKGHTMREIAERHGVCKQRAYSVVAEMCRQHGMRYCELAEMAERERLI